MGRPYMSETFHSRISSQGGSNSCTSNSRIRSSTTSVSDRGMTSNPNPRWKIFQWSIAMKNITRHSFPLRIASMTPFVFPIASSLNGASKRLHNPSSLNYNHPAHHNDHKRLNADGVHFSCTHRETKSTLRISRVKTNRWPPTPKWELRALINLVRVWYH